MDLNIFMLSKKKKKQQEEGSAYYMVPFTESSRTGKTIHGDRNQDEIASGKGEGNNWLERS